MEELAVALQALGSDGLMAFTIYAALDFVEMMVFFGLSTWAIRTGWKAWKKYEWEQD